MAVRPVIELSPEEQALIALKAVIADEAAVMAEALAGWRSGTNSGLRYSVLRSVFKACRDLDAKHNGPPFKGGILLENGNTLYPPI